MKIVYSKNEKLNKFKIKFSGWQKKNDVILSVSEESPSFVCPKSVILSVSEESHLKNMRSFGLRPQDDMEEARSFGLRPQDDKGTDDVILSVSEESHLKMLDKNHNVC